MVRKNPARHLGKPHLFLEKGFTLLEILLAILLLAIGVVVLSQAWSVGLLASTDVENVDLASNIAQAKMEEIKNTSFASLASSGPTADAQFSNFNTTVAVTGTDPKQVVVTVAWNAKGGSTNVALTTLVANY